MDTPQDVVKDQEKELRKLAKELAPLLETKAWAAYVRLVEQAVETRKEILTQPLDTLSSGLFAGLDFETKVAALEKIKGAIIGLRLASSLPAYIIETAKAIAASENEEENES